MYARRNQSSCAEFFTTEGVWAEGSFKDVYRGRYTTGKRKGKLNVCKVMRGADPYLASVFDCELEVVAKAQEIIDKFNTGNFVSKVIYLNEPEVWQGTEGPRGWHGKQFLVEPMISDYQKFNSNSGWVAKDGATWGDVMQALSHFSYHVTGGHFVLCDLQGGYYRDGIVLTDPVMMSRDHRYGPTDLGSEGMTAFFNRHRCNRYCRYAWTRPKARHSSVIPTRGTSMMNSKGQMLVPTRASRAPLTRQPVIEEDDEDYYSDSDDY